MAFTEAIGKQGHRQGDMLVALKNGTRDTPELILSDEGHQHVLPYLWNPSTLAFEVSTGGGGAGSVTVTNFPALQPVSVANGADVAQGTTTDAAWVSGAGTVIALLKKIASAGGSAVSIADGADANQGTTTDAAVVTDVAGTMAGKLRGLVKILASVWDSVNGRLKVDGSAVTQPVSGAFWQATQPVSAASLPLPTGASTEATLALIKAKTDNLDVALSTRAVTGLTDAQIRATALPVSLAALPALTAGAALVGKVGIDQTTPGTTNAVQTLAGSKIQLTNAAGTQNAYVLPTGQIATAVDGTDQFTDTFDGAVIDTTNRWNAPVLAGTGTVTQASGSLTLAIGTTASNAAAISSQPTFGQRGFGFIKLGDGIQLEAAITTNTHRFWGLGTPNASFTASTPLAEAYGVEIDTTGVLNACIYAGNARVFAQALTKPTDGLFHSFVAYVRSDVVIWFMDNLENPVAFAQWKTANISGLPKRLHSIAHTVAPTANTMVVGAVGISDSSSSSQGMADGTYGWRKVTVKPASAAAVATDTGHVVALHPSSPVPLPTLTKGIQGATGVAVQQLHDAGRNTRVFMLDAYTVAPAAEALASVVQWYGNVAVAATTTPAVVPAGKILRLSSWKLMYQSLATVGYAVVRVRCNTAGLGALASPLVFSFEAGTGAGATTVAETGGLTTETGDFPEGLEIPAAAGLAFSIAGYGPTGVLTLEGGIRFAVTGYEY